jgi:hypothetical protein
MGVGMRGPGELQIETDRRIIRDRIAKLKEDLKIIDRQKTTQRGNRGAMVRVALVATHFGARRFARRPAVPISTQSRLDWQ